LPPRVESLAEQVERCITQLRLYKNNIEKYIYLQTLLNTNEILFYRLLLDHLIECLPLVYTPTVGEGCIKHSLDFMQTKGLYLSLEQDKGEISEILSNWPVEPDIIVVTDGSRILGLGDLGINGMGIPIGKLSLYIAGAGFHPRKTLPVCLDVGTNNKSFLDDKFYMGIKKERNRGKEFFEFTDEFIDSVHKKWPNCLVQFEDFSTDVAFDLLEKNRTKMCCFNDDIQGTGAVVLSGFINAVKVSGIPIMKQKIVFYGAGSAAVGVAQTIYEYLAFEGHKEDDIKKMIYLVDSKGIVTINRGDSLASHKIPFARKDFKDKECITDLLDIVKHVKPTCLIGLSSQPGDFTKEVLAELCNFSEKPIILSLSNPSSKAECTAEQAYRFTNGKCVFASGSPWDNVELNGKIYVPGQGNNMYIFPGLGLGGVVSKSKIISENMILVASRSLANYVTQEELDKGRIYPELEKIRDISFHIANDVCKQSVKDKVCGLSDIPNDFGELIKSYVFDPHYPTHDSKL